MNAIGEVKDPAQEEKERQAKAAQENNVKSNVNVVKFEKPSSDGGGFVFEAQPVKAVPEPVKSRFVI